MELRRHTVAGQEIRELQAEFADGVVSPDVTCDNVDGTVRWPGKFRSDEMCPDRAERGSGDCRR